MKNSILHIIDTFYFSRMALRQLTLCVCCFAVGAFALQGQPSIGVSPINKEVEVNEEFFIDITSTDFNNIVSCQFSLLWDPALLEYDTFSSELPQILFFNELNVSEGKFSFVWAESGSNILDFPDETVVLRLMFKGLDDGITSLEFTNTPTQLLAIYEAAPDSLVETAYGNLENGTITVGNPVSYGEELKDASFQVFQNNPNPFTEHTFIPFTLTESEIVNLDIFDINGINIYQYSKQYDEGTHFIRIEKEALPELGTYLYQLKTSNTFVTKKMILVR